MNHRAVILVLLAVAAAASGAWAEEHKVVRHHDLDLATAQGSRRMFDRIDKAALKVCGGGRGSLEAVNRAIRRNGCWLEATSDAVVKLGAPRVTEAWQAAVGRRAGSAPR